MADEKTITEMTQAAFYARNKTLLDILKRTPPGTVNKPNKEGYTAIQVMNTKSPSTAKILLDHHADPNVRDSTQKSIVHDIAEKGCLETLDLLLQHDADALARDNKGNTPAHLAASIGGDSRIEILKRLSQHCTLKETNNEGKTPLDLATSKNHGKIVDWLQKFGLQATTDTSVPDQKVDQNEGTEGAEPGTSSPSPAH